MYMQRIYWYLGLKSKYYRLSCKQKWHTNIDLSQYPAYIFWSVAANVKSSPFLVPSPVDSFVSFGCSIFPLLYKLGFFSFYSFISQIHLPLERLSQMGKMKTPILKMLTYTWITSHSCVALLPVWDCLPA